MPTDRSTSKARTAAHALVILSVVGCAQGRPKSVASRASVGDSAPAHHGDSAFSALQRRGADARGMGVDQYMSIHRFDALEDGGRIELQRAVDDSAGITQIRKHLHEIARAFAVGDFSTPAFVHLQQVPGTSVMAARRSLIRYEEHDLPRGGEVRITTHDPEALAAIRQFMAYQRNEHHAGGMTDSGTSAAQMMPHG